MDEHLTVVALTPEDMGPAQASLGDWCDRKRAALQTELGELEANHLTLIESGMKAFALAAAMRRTEKRIIYYDKIKAAVAAGFLIVPNFPVDVFAVRVQRARPREMVHDSHWGGFTAEPELLPAGEGRYVDDQVTYRDESHTETVEGKEKHVRRYVSEDYDAVDFPYRVVKPEVLAATQRAMAMRIFDRMGAVQNRQRGDPIVVGQLLDPRGQSRLTTFFIAWWLDTTTL